MYLTKNTVYALPPERSPHREAQTAPMPISRIIDNRPHATTPEPDPKIGRAALDRMWREMVQAANASQPRGSGL